MRVSRGEDTAFQKRTIWHVCGTKYVIVVDDVRLCHPPNGSLLSRPADTVVAGRHRDAEAITGLDGRA